MSDHVLISARNITKSFAVGKKGRHIAVNDVSLDMYRGETLALVGESGCGKTTLARILMRLVMPDSGNVMYDGTNIMELSESAFGPYRQKMQMVFQDPATSLDPRMKVRDIIAEPLDVWHVYKNREEKEKRVEELLEMVELSRGEGNRYPRELSGGQRQRVGIARAIAIKPELIICDESVSALDVSIQAQILNLLKSLKQELGLSCLFISHDLAVVDFIADRVCVMKDGRICETGDAASVFGDPQSEYTKYLLDPVRQM